MARSGIATLWAHRRLRIALVAILVAIPLLGGGYQLLRHSSLSSVEHVQVSGLAAVHGADTAAIETALTGAAHDMSTLAVSPAALQAAVVAYPIVGAVRVHPSFPHGLRIEVIERPPVAALVVNGASTAVAADGVVLGPGFLSSSLPQVSEGKSAASGASTAASASTSTSTSTTAGTSTLPPIGGSVRGASLLGALSILGAAPAELAHEVTRVYEGPKGLTVALHGNLLAYFGDATLPHAKWLSLARVLADPSSAGATYVDVRLPERPAAGFAPGTSRPDASSTELESSGASADPNTAAELASGLDAAVGGGAGSSGGSGSATSSGSGTGAEPSSSGETAGSGTGASETGSSGSSSSTGEATSTSASSEAASTGASETSSPSGAPSG